MRITEIETYIAGNPWKNWLFCRLSTDEGISGIGEGTVNGFGKATEAAIHEMFQVVKGMDPFDTSRLSLLLFRDFFSDGGQIQGAALSAIETACWDIKGKALGVPLYQLLGGKVHDKLRVYANGWYQSEAGRTPEAFAEQAKEVVRRGYTALKFDPFGTAWRVVDRPEFHLTVDIVAAVRDAVGPDVDILIEGHNRFSVATALQFAEAIAPYQPSWFEAAVPPYRIASMVEVAHRSPVPIACGEDYYSREQFSELLSHDAVSVVQLEPQHMGLTAARDVVGMAHAHNAVIAPHSAQGPICSLVCAHLNAASPNFYLHEFFDEFNAEWEGRLLTHHLTQENGYVVPPEAPGLGADLNIDEILRHPYNPQNFLPLFRTGWEQRRGFESTH
ncbi:mandelate racemase/muconate lactonizing enzyme family protein [Sulfobacillus harzensis]|uniref:Mandelate racemase/muconate lactonizing enzyme family protein n=1 Tax=Sulfobacillus harzensis TaxID=2729629 RepID=A0A7Y0L3V6_9FIRM|nr:mandelate racemase/muconate lactonizing enzyme family protein [Sulfobacillus harzensis]NMP22808.1 mandelate racemase/muconate lactonizing enzyme family protein [Sulfobacillus harzensis]